MLSKLGAELLDSSSGLPSYYSFQEPFAKADCKANKKIKCVWCHYIKSKVNVLNIH